MHQDNQNNQQDKQQDKQFNETSQYLQNLGYTLLSANKDRLTVQCSNGHIFERSFKGFKRGSISCSECERDLKRTFLQSVGYELLPAKGEKLQVNCLNGHIFERQWNDFKKGVVGCIQCQQEEKEKFLKSIDYTLLSIEGSHVTVECKNNHTFSRKYSHFTSSGVTSCLECEKEKKKSCVENVGYTLLNIEGKNITIQCNSNHKFKRAWSDFQRGNTNCPQCNQEDKRTFLQSVGYKLLAISGENVNVECSEGHTFTRALGSFRTGTTVCLQCEYERKRIILKDMGHKLISIDGENVNVECSEGHTFTRRWGNFNKGVTICTTCFPSHSSQEIEIMDFLNENNIKHTASNWNIISPKEIDIFIPEKKLAIEFDGIYWHSEQQGKNEKYHLGKTEDCLKQGIELFHIFENEWKFKKEIWKSMIFEKLNKNKEVFVEDCILKEVLKEEEEKFLEENHLQGFIESKICLGLYLESELLCLMSFKKDNFSNSWEVLRFAYKNGIVVTGGALELFNYFLKNYSKGENILAYSNRRYSLNHIWNALGFSFLHNIEPNYFYFKNSTWFTLENSQKYQKHNLKNILKDFDESLTEVENMRINGFNRIWDCGNSVWIYKQKEENDRA